MNQFPVEILNTILSFTGTRVRLALGRAPDPKQMFVEGGPCLILETILKKGADIKSLFEIKRHVPSSIALCKAILTENIDFIKRVCLIWNTTESNDAFALACRNRFVWAIQHIRPTNQLTVRQYNRIYFEIGHLHKIDLTDDKPFDDLINTNIHIKSERLDYLPFKMSLGTFELLFLYVIKGMEQEACDIIDNDLDRTTNLLDLILRSIDEGIYKLPLDLFFKYGSIYGVSENDVASKLIRVRNVEALEYLNVPFLEIHETIIDKDVPQLNTFLLQDKQLTANIMRKYDPTISYYFNEITEAPYLALDRYGYWEGLSIRPRFSFGFYDTSDDGSINMTIEKIQTNEISSIQYFSDAYGRYAPPSRILLSFINLHGHHVLDHVQTKLYIVPYLTFIDIESTCKLLSILLECKYPIIELDFNPRPYTSPRPAVYVSGKTIYHTSYPVDSHKCHLEDDLYTKSEFLYILFAKDIAIAFRTYSEMTHFF